MRSIKRILVATDFSTCAARATDYAAELAARLGAQVLVLHVYSPPIVYLPEGVWALPSMDVSVRSELNRAIATVSARVSAAGAPAVESMLAEGGAWQEIVRVAAERQCDVIVVGTHGRGGVSHLINGSVAEKVVRKAPCPVLTVKKE